MYYSVKDFTSSTATWHESLQCIFYAVMKQKIILFLKTTLTTSFTLLERVFTNLHRTTACLLFLQNLLDLHCYLPHFSSFPPCWKLFSPYVVPADSVSVEEGGKWFVITGWSDPEVCTQAFLRRTKARQPVGGEAIVGGCTRRKTTHNPSISSPAWVSPFFSPSK